MTPRYELAAPAERDLEDIFFEVKERHGLLVAERVYDNLLRTFDLLAQMPEMGRHRPELWPPALSILGHGACVHRVPRGRPADSHRSDRARFARLEWVRAPRLTCVCVAPRMRPAGRASGERHRRVGGRSGDFGADTGR